MDRLTPALYAIAGQVSRTGEPRAAMETILQQALTVFRADAGSIAILDPDTNRLQIEVHHGLPSDVREHALRLDQGITGWTAFHGKPVLVPNVAEEPRYIRVRTGTRCEMAAPLEIEGHILGALVLDADVTGAWTSDDLIDLVQLAGEAARTLQRIWLLRSLQDKARQLETLTVVGQSLVSKLQLQELLDTITRETRAIFGSCIGTILLHQPEAETLSAESWSGPEEFVPPAKEDWPGTECLANAVVRTGRIVEYAHLHSAEVLELRDVPRTPAVQAALLAPIVVEGAVIGVLASYSARPHRHSNEEKRLLGALANLGAVAIANARLYARVFQSEDTLRKNETLTTLGLLAAEIAHEVRNPLTVIKLLYSSLKIEFAAGDPRIKDMRIIGEKLNQLEATVSRVLNLAKAPGALHSRWPLDEIITDTLLLVRLKLHQSMISVSYEPAPEMLFVEVNKGQIQQVLLNLILNSTHAMPKGGRITLRTTRETRPEGPPVVVLDFSDTGHGISAELQPKLFASVLMGRTEGTGLGLAIVKRLVQSHHGDIELLATGDTGTTFRINLPLAPGT
ncbi:MAG TPA: GAF domain-containing protein [Opitutaceae bacterium]|nr:GAF domain-containing protein [Opitutaceae bacterium]